MARTGAATDDAVMEALTAAETPMSAYQLLDRLRPRGIQSPPVVYRALDRLEKAGRIHRLEGLNAYFACCGRDHAKGTVFAVCTACKRVEEWSGEGIDAIVTAQAARAGFAVEGRTIEIRGLCAQCRGEAGAEHDHDHAHDHGHDHVHGLSSHGPGCGCSGETHEG
jgi:Fur family zinc uptake transcriptional regulator